MRAPLIFCAAAERSYLQKVEGGRVQVRWSAQVEGMMQEACVEAVLQPAVPGRALHDCTCACCACTRSLSIAVANCEPPRPK